METEFAHWECDVKGNRIRGQESLMFTHCGCTNSSVDYSWYLHGRPSEFANLGICQDATSQSTTSNPTPYLISISKREYNQFLGRTQSI